MKPIGDSAPTTSWSLEETLTKIASHHRVEGVMLLGSTGTDDFTPTSDYDVLVVFSTLPAPLRIVNTWIDGRLAEIYCTTTEAIDRIVKCGAPWPDASEEATLLGWLQAGRIYADRHGSLAVAQTRAADVLPPTLPGDDPIYEAWRKIGYNLAQITRYLVADDPLSQTAVDLRLLYSVDEVKVHYFTVRTASAVARREASDSLLDGP
jgi:predicted nucleotidyltransferase